jgi:hypothetical protein
LSYIRTQRPAAKSLFPFIQEPDQLQAFLRPNLIPTEIGLVMIGRYSLLEIWPILPSDEKTVPGSTIWKSIGVGNRLLPRFSNGDFSDRPELRCEVTVPRHLSGHFVYTSGIRLATILSHNAEKKN